MATILTDGKGPKEAGKSVEIHRVMRGDYVWFNNGWACVTKWIHEVDNTVRLYQDRELLMCEKRNETVIVRRGSFGSVNINIS